MSQTLDRYFYKPRAWLALAVASASCWACAAGTPAPRPTPKPVSAAPPPRPELTADEAILRDRLRAHVDRLARSIGERNLEHPWELAEAADYVAIEIEALGLPIERLGYELDGAVVQNLAVTIPGGARGDEVLVVGAHYDSAPGSRGENGNATGVAAVLELARLFRGAQNERTLRLVAFAVSAPPHAGGQDMGSLRYARELEAKQAKVVGMINLDRIGILGDDGVSPGSSSRVPPGPRVRLGATAGGDGMRQVLQAQLEGDPLTVQIIPMDTSTGSDHWAFAQIGVPAVWVTGAGDDRPIDYDAMSRLVMRVRFGLAELLGETPINDGMLTPDMGLVR